MRAPAHAETIVVPLIEQAAADLARTRERTRLSRTDIVNRAILLNEFIDGELAAGAELLLRRPGGPTYRIAIF